MRKHRNEREVSVGPNEVKVYYWLPLPPNSFYSHIAMQTSEHYISYKSSRDSSPFQNSLTDDISRIGMRPNETITLELCEVYKINDRFAEVKENPRYKPESQRGAFNVSDSATLTHMLLELGGIFKTKPSFTSKLNHQAQSRKRIIKDASKTWLAPLLTCFAMLFCILMTIIIYQASPDHSGNRNIDDPLPLYFGSLSFLCCCCCIFNILCIKNIIANGPATHTDVVASYVAGEFTTGGITPVPTPEGVMALCREFKAYARGHVPFSIFCCGNQCFRLYEIENDFCSEPTLIDENTPLFNSEGIV